MKARLFQLDETGQHCECGGQIVEDVTTWRIYCEANSDHTCANLTRDGHASLAGGDYQRIPGETYDENGMGTYRCYYCGALVDQQ